MIGAGFMKVASIFTMDKFSLVVAARLVSTVSMTLSIYFVIKIADKLFKDKEIYKILFVVFIAFQPITAFLASYINNDSTAVLATTMIIYLWILGLESNWKTKHCVLLGLAIGFCALTYYNAYGYILCSIILCLVSVTSNKMKAKDVWQKILIVGLIAITFAGWWFVRNAILYNGDFLGMNSMYDCGEKYAMPGYQLSQRDTYQNQGISVFSMIFDTNWIITTIKSFICTTGYMQYMISGKRFCLYLIIILFGMIMMLIALKRKYQFKFKFENYFIICLILCVLIPIILSIKYSYSIDYQPQGRYIMSILIPIALFMSIGYEYFSEFIENKIQIKSRYIELSMIGIYILLFVICYSSYIAVCFGSTII